MSARIDALVSVFEKYRGHDRLSHKLEEAAGDLGEAAPGPRLWEAFRAGRIDLGAAQQVWRFLYEAPDDLAGDDVLAFVRAVSARYPGGYEREPGGYCSSILDKDMPPGHLDPVAHLIEERSGNDVFVEPLRTGWASLPDPYRVAVGYALARSGLIPWTDLPQGDVLDLARIRLSRSAGRTQVWAERNPIPPQVWGRALVEVGLNTPDLKYESPAVLAEAAPYATPEQLAQLLQKERYGWYTHEAVRPLAGAFSARGWEEQVRGLKALTEPGRYSLNGPEPLIVQCWLLACGAHGMVPPPERDQELRGFLDRWYREFNRSEENDLVRECLQVIPVQRLQALLLQTTSDNPWAFYAACPTDAVLQRTAERLLDGPWSSRIDLEALLGRSSYKYEDGILRPILAALVPHATAALRGKGGRNRGLLVTLLAHAGTADAAEGLVLALGESARGDREEARSALLRLGSAAAPALQAALGARRKVIREQAAGILAEILGRPGAGGQGDSILAALEESAGARWIELADRGADLVEIYWSYLERLAPDQYLSYWSRASHTDPCTRWVDLLERFRDAPGMAERAALAAGGFSHWSGADYLADLHELFGDIGPALAAVIAAGRFGRPSGMGRRRDRSFEVYGALAWLREHSPVSGIPAFVWALSHKHQRVRALALEALPLHGDPAAGGLGALLTSGSAELAAVAAEGLALLAPPGAAEILEAALPKSAAKEAIQAALARLRAVGLDVSAFPATAEGDAALDAALAALPRAEPHELLGDGPLPPAQWRTGAALSPGAQAWLVGALSQESGLTRSPLLRAVRPRLSDETCWALSETIEERVGYFDEGWPVYVQAVIGSPSQIRAIGAELEVLVSSQSARWGAEAIDCLVRHGSDEAVRSLDHWARRSRKDMLRGRAAGGLERLAAARGLSVPDLIDGAISDFGFDHNGEQTLDYGGRKLTVKLGPDNEVQIRDGAGRPVKALPAARKGEDPGEVSALKARISEMKKQIKAIHAAQIQRLDLALTAGRTWPIDAWSARFERHPLMHAFSRRLLWQVVDAAGQPGAAFALTEEGERLGADLEPVALPAGSSVRLLHPIELSDDERAAWAGYLADAGFVQPFPQLDRPLYRADDLKPSPWRGLAEVPPVIFRQRLLDRGWDKADHESSGYIDGASKQYGELIASISTTTWSLRWPDGDPVEITGLSVRSGEASVAWEALPPRLLSELAYDLRRLASG